MAQLMAQWDDCRAALAKLESSQRPQWEDYLGFYSSWLNGFFREPWAMLMPLDDHGFHRGDAVFECVRIYEGAYFDLQGHLARLQRSAQAIGLTLPKSLIEIQQLCLRLATLCGASQGALRLYITRGPGGFSSSPKESSGAQIYAAITKMKPPAARFYSEGCRAIFSSVAAKDEFWSQIKSCNYLQNVLMKQETLERGFDFAISIGENGRLCEGSTENFMLITHDNEMLVPNFAYTLRGTTIQVVMQIAERLVASGDLKGVRCTDVYKDDLLTAREAAFVGTTLGVLPMTEIEGLRLGAVGPVCQRLQRDLLEVMTHSKELRTVF